MNPELITFTKFNDIALAYQLVDLLKKNNIEYIMEDVPVTFDPGFRITNPETKEYVVKVKNTDFLKIQQLLDQQVTEAVNNVESDYYLFDFTDGELIDVLAKRDEWNSFDILLARKILSDRGNTVNDADIANLNAKRIQELRKPEPSQNTWIIIGYICSLLGGVFGIFIGWHLWTQRKILPNGEQVFEYNENDRKQGKRIFIISTIISIALFMAKLFGTIFSN